jgi:ribonucleoside-diphosphate reductase alpha chain
VYGAGYQMAWELTILEQVKIYAIFQKWADQSISADVYRDRSGDNLEIKHSELLDEFAAFVHYGVKSRYYSNSLTGDSSESQATVDGCASGACTL